jgi:hypothetical protein
MGSVRTAAAVIALGLGLSLAPATALAQGGPGANDPQAGSPAGTIYQIPLDTARRDAAPRGRHGSGAGADPSPIRSADNGFGSSAQVPGTGSSGGAGTAAGSSSAAGGEPSGSGSKGSSSAHTSSTRGASAREALIQPAVRPSPPSSVRTYLLIAIGIAVALALGAAARVAARNR